MTYEDDYEEYQDCYSIYDLDVDTTEYQTKMFNGIKKLIEDSVENLNEDDDNPRYVLYVNDVFYQNLHEIFIEIILNNVNMPDAILSNDNLFDQIINGTFDAEMTSMPGFITDIENYCKKHNIQIKGRLNYFRF